MLATNKHDPNGFHMKFENGWTVSVQWGPGNYCSNHDLDAPLPLDLTKRLTGHTAEIAAWDKDDNWHNFGGDTVSGWNPPEAVAAFISEIAAK